MKRFLLHVVLFCLILFVIAFFTDEYVSRKIKNIPEIAHGEFSIWNDIYAGNINADMVVCGSSRAWVNIDPLLLTDSLHISCYNLGVDGQHFPLQHFRYKELLRFNNHPKIVIYSLDIFTLTKNETLYNYEQYLPYMLFNADTWKATRKYGIFTIWDFIIPGLRYYGKKSIINKAFGNQQNEDSFQRVRGYRGQEQSWNNDLENAKSKMKSYSITIDRNILKDFEAYLEECRENNTKVIFVYTPEYIDGQKFASNRDSLMQVYKNISTKCHIPFYDYSGDSISYQKKYFYNASHMNKTGSQLFTKELITDIKNDTSIQSLSHSLVNK